MADRSPNNPRVLDCSSLLSHRIDEPYSRVWQLNRKSPARKEPSTIRRETASVRRNSSCVSVTSACQLSWRSALPRSSRGTTTRAESLSPAASRASASTQPPGRRSREAVPGKGNKFRHGTIERIADHATSVVEAAVFVVKAEDTRPPEAMEREERFVAVGRSSCLCEFENDVS